MNAVEEFLASLRRLFDFRTRPPAEPISAPTSDRPPPQEIPLPAEPVSADVLDVPVFADELVSPDEAVVQDVTTVGNGVSEVPAVTRDADSVAEIRALLEAMAEPSVTAPEPAAEFPPAVIEPSAPPEEPVQTTAPLDEPAAAVTEPAADLTAGTLVLTLDAPPATFTIGRSTATLGRGDDNTIRLDDLSVSRRHARIVYRRAAYWLSDLGSMGGTWVNGSRLAAPHQIGVADVIDIGHCRLTVSYAREEAKVDVKVKTSRRPARR